LGNESVVRPALKIGSGEWGVGKIIGSEIIGFLAII
jgi:hypothetical protein